MANGIIKEDMGKRKMKDNFDLQNEDRFKWGLIVVLLLNAYYWVNVYWYGFLIPTIWTIVIASIVGLYFKMNDKI